MLSVATFIASVGPALESLMDAMGPVCPGKDATALKKPFFGVPCVKALPSSLAERGR